MNKRIIAILIVISGILGCTQERTPSDESTTSNQSEQQAQDNQPEPSAEEMLKTDQEKMDSAKRALGIE